MSAIEESVLEDAFSGKVRRKSNNTGNLKSKASRVAKGVPEVVVKIKSFAKGGGSVKRQMQYISRNGDVAMETEQGEQIEGRAAVTEHIRTWLTELDNGGSYPNRRDTAHIILSMPPGTDAEAVLLASREFAKKTFAENHEYVLALHTDEESPHVHLIVKTLGFDGKRLHIERQHSQQWRESFAAALRDQGTEAEATPAASRGRPSWQYSAAAKHIAEGDEKRDPRPSTARAAQVYAARDAILAEADGQPAQTDPGRVRAEQAAATAKSTWTAVADTLAKSDDRTLRDLSAELRQFAASIQPAESTRQQLVVKLLDGPGVRELPAERRATTLTLPTAEAGVPDPADQDPPRKKRADRER